VLAPNLTCFSPVSLRINKHSQFLQFYFGSIFLKGLASNGKSFTSAAATNPMGFLFTSDSNPVRPRGSNRANAHPILVTVVYGSRVLPYCPDQA
jgi:hypothetical protein